MPDFLLEIGVEEIPARMLSAAEDEFRARVELFLVNRGLHLGGANISSSFSTPRRLGLVMKDVMEKQRDSSERVMGPSYEIAFKDGKPTDAAVGFAKKTGVPIEQFIELHKTARPGARLGAEIRKPGRSMAEILMESLPKEIASIYWPKNMYWRGGKPERFVRPIRWIVAMLGSEIIPLDFAGIQASNQSRGHRILGPVQVAIPAPAQYAETLQKAHVMIPNSDREYKIRKALDAATRTVSGARWREDAELLKTVVNLTEWPSAILGSFDKEYLSLPEEVLVTVMRDHQKYFAVEDAAGKLAPHFLAVLNTDADPDGLIRHGNERVLRARFNDARFFWDTDQKTSLVNRVEMLKAVTFQKDLGSYAAKAERMVELSDRLCRTLDGAGMKVDPNAINQAARYAKTDLTTELVKEFTELQGVIGGLYAKAQGMRPTIADAIYDQYKPHSTEDSAPRTLEAAVVSIADKADSIAGMFALGLVPSGSKDPFALRRQANGIVKTIVEHKLPLSLSRLMSAAREQYAGSEAEKKFTLSGDAYVQAVQSFFRERLEFYLRDVLGLAYDVVNATLAAGADDVVDAAARAEAVAKVRPSSDFESISVAFKRMKNILRQAAETKKKIATPFNPAALKDEEEKKLAEAVPGVAAKVKELSMARQYEPALIEISRLRPPIDAFFDKVMVMVEDENLRAQRLGLLQTLVNEFSSIADFSEIVTAG